MRRTDRWDEGQWQLTVAHRQTSDISCHSAPRRLALDHSLHQETYNNWQYAASKRRAQLQWHNVVRRAYHSLEQQQWQQQQQQ